MTNSPDLAPPQPGHVLVVDDDPKIHRLLQRALTEGGYRVSLAADGQEGLDKARELRPDVIVLDVTMPKVDGYEVCRQLKADPATAPIAILMTTGLTAREDRMKGIAAGVNDFLTKPYDLEELNLRIRNAMQMKRLYDELQRKYLELKATLELRDSLATMLQHDTAALARILARAPATTAATATATAPDPLTPDTR